MLLYYSIVLSAIVSGCILLLTFIVRKLKSNNVNVNKNVAKTVSDCSRKDKQTKSNKRKATDTKWVTQQTSKHSNYNHPWLLTSLKGHTGTVLAMDLSSNGKYLVSCAEDRTVLLWCLKDFIVQKERKSLRVNIDFDHASLIKWSPDSKAFLITRAKDNVVEVYKIERKKDSWLGSVTKAHTFPKAHEEEITNLGIAPNGRFIMTCTSKTDLLLWTLRGKQLAHIDTYLMSTMCAKITPCSRFVVASGFAPDVKVWEICFTKTGEFQQVKRAFELTGHTSGIYDVAFNADTSRMATVSKDGTWKVFNTNIEYLKGEDPHLQISSKYKLDDSAAVHIALSPNGEVVAISTGNDVSLYSVRSGTLDQRIENIYSAGSITSVTFDSLGLHMLVSGERHIRLFHNVTGYKCNIVTAQEKLRGNVTSATKERLEAIIAESEAFLKRIKN